MGDPRRAVRGSAGAASDSGHATDAAIATVSDSLSDTAAKFSFRSLHNADSAATHCNQDSDQ
jgi:hypothetical protein